MTAGIRIQPGDVYCPFCKSQTIMVEIARETNEWCCDRCPARWNWDHNGIDWIWPQDVPERYRGYLYPNDIEKRTPGCPWCGTQNIDVMHTLSDRPDWRCLRQACANVWTGTFVVTQFVKGGKWRVSRWLIKVPTRLVPFRRTLDNPTTYPHQETR